MSRYSQTVKGVSNFLYDIRDEEHDQAEEGFSPKPYFLFGLNFLLTTGWLLILLPITIWAMQVFPANLQIDYRWVISYVISYVLVGGIGEWLFHINVLHKQDPLIPILEKAYISHHIIHHRELTPVLINPDKGINDSQYPITQPRQVESATFPWYTIGLLWLLGAAITILFQWLIPSIPMLLPFCMAIVTAVFFYENKHALDHFPETGWRKACQTRYIGKLVLLLHCHHLLHHWGYRKNLNVVGVLLFPLGDFLFGSFCRSEVFERHWVKGDLSPGRETMKVILDELTTPRGLQWPKRKRVRQAPAPSPVDSEPEEVTTT